jgi:hypothetical protein
VVSARKPAGQLYVYRVSCGVDLRVNPYTSKGYLTYLSFPKKMFAMVS